MIDNFEFKLPQLLPPLVSVDMSEDLSWQDLVDAHGKPLCDSLIDNGFLKIWYGDNQSEVVKITNSGRAIVMSQDVYLLKDRRPMTNSSLKEALQFLPASEFLHIAKFGPYTYRELVGRDYAHSNIEDGVLTISDKGSQCLEMLHVQEGIIQNMGEVSPDSETSSITREVFLQKVKQESKAWKRASIRWRWSYNALRIAAILLGVFTPAIAAIVTYLGSSSILIYMLPEFNSELGNLLEMVFPILAGALGTIAIALDFDTRCKMLRGSWIRADIIAISLGNSEYSLEQAFKDFESILQTQLKAFD